MTRRSLLGIGALAIVARVVYVAVFMRGYAPNSDAHSYFTIALAVARGDGYVFTLPFEYVHATAIRPPLFTTAAAAAMRIFGSHLGVAQGVNMVAGSGAAVLGALTAHRIAGPRAGWCAGAVLALYPPLISNDVTTLVESFALLLLFACVLFLIDGRTVLAGASLGLLMLDRASAQWLIILFGAWVVWRFGWLHALRLAVVAVLVVSPWIVRNWVHVGGPVIVATNGYNLNAKYSEEAQHDERFVDAYFDGRFAQMRVDAIDEVDLDRKLREHALRDLRKHPGQLAYVAGNNLVKWFELRPSWNTDAERLDGRNLDVRSATWFLFFPVTALGVFGLIRARRSPAAQLLILAGAYFTVVCAFSIAVPRLRSIFDGCAAVGAGVALALLLDSRVHLNGEAPVRRAMRTRASVVVIAIAVLAIGGGALAWRHQTEQHARQSLAATVENNGGAVGAVARELTAGIASAQPPQITQSELNRLHELVRVLGIRAPEVASGLRDRVGGALRQARIAERQAFIVGTLSAAEYFDRAGGTPSLARVRERYEREVLPTDPTLGLWDDVASGRDLQELELRLQDLATALDRAS